MTRTVTHFYRLFDVLLQSDLELPGIPVAPEGRPDLTVRDARRWPTTAPEFETYHEWRTPKGELAIEGLRHGDEYLLRFPGKAVFLLDPPAGLIETHFEAHADPVLRGHLLTDQVIPRLLQSRGRCMVHASVVELKSGPVLAFVGDSGSGKSTLAAGFAQLGATVLADDCVELRFDDATVHVLPGYSSLRLWSDSNAHFASLADDRFESVLCGAKYRLMPRSRSAEPEPVGLDGVFLLQPLPGDLKDVSLSAEPADRSADGIAAIHALFALEPASHDTLRRNLRFLQQLFDGACPVYRLRFPHAHERLGDVHRLVEDVLRTAAGAEGV